MTAPLATTAPDPVDGAGIAAVVAEAERAFGTADPDLLVASIAADVVVVGADGARVHGRPAVLAAARAGFAGPWRGQHARYVLTRAALVGPDVAIAHTDAHATDADGTPRDVGHSMTTLWVLARRDGRWWVVARHDTLVSRPAG
ncbi:SgcJ/EcaC family oxidoreductase [Pseudonocardia hydrocarbonoxydans]|uniref:DUF4440 domain-containing protein n=1 Tax=Pseudonocardia hydrocarbonoxydans TaxID=76726 RepID=A0A4Y3WMY5_9PSEU|nr:SgcJ/EcaC family oxidoreductase [Pseudonocardia hydrocarbonoxydans]GEC19601.1 hypothetical protein PHY01_18840 [Pseudonocardia hydrocarbonoxydans]